MPILFQVLFARSQAGSGSNISGALDAALSINDVNYIYLLSVGDPSTGIKGFDELRKFIKAKNVRKVRISALAAGLGERLPGIPLLKGIAEDSGGNYDYINMTKIPDPKK